MYIFDIIWSATAPAIFSFIAAAITVFLQKMLRATARRKENISYSERLNALISNLGKATDEVDGILAEMAQVAKDRSENVQLLEKELRLLETKEQELKEKINLLQNTPLPVVEHFAKLLEPGERRSVRRDFMLFGAGVILSTLIALILQMFGPTHKDTGTEVSKQSVAQPAPAGSNQFTGSRKTP
jgi:hypothetical protein